MPVKFHKMHGLGNDFILLDLRFQEFPLDAETARRLSARHTGIGCDQLLVIGHPRDDSQLASFEVWNADGSRAEQCGNGARCMGLYLQMRSQTPLGRFSLGGPAGVVHLECLADGMVQVDMGQPVFEAAQIPLLLELIEGWYTLEIDGQNYRLGAVSMGNPHALMLVDDLEQTDVARLGAAISSHPAFPNGSNAGFGQLIDRENLRLRVYERGAGETLACGSGACAAVGVLRRAGMVEKTMRVTQAGGDLIITWTGDKKPVIMKGPATHVFEGKLT
ncbi:MAG: diaminopimelate epimerase [Xanthomonadales bacterium]|nr:diaminopimelate epimerase [Xanthomonadales bacterium]